MTAAEPARRALHLGVADHLGWAIVVAASSDGVVADRRRIELVGPDLPPAPIHHIGGPHDLHRTGPPVSDDELAAIVAAVRASATSTIRRELDGLARDLHHPIATLSLRRSPADFPTDIPTLRRVPYESRADPLMYRALLADAGRQRGWEVHTFEAKTVEASAREAVGPADDDVLERPRAALGPPWAKDHRLALAAAIVAAADH